MSPTQSTTNLGAQEALDEIAVSSATSSFAKASETGSNASCFLGFGGEFGRIAIFTLVFLLMLVRVLILLLIFKPAFVAVLVSDSVGNMYISTNIRISTSSSIRATINFGMSTVLDVELLRSTCGFVVVLVFVFVFVYCNESKHEYCYMC